MSEVSRNTLVALASVLLVVTVLATVLAFDANNLKQIPTGALTSTQPAQASFTVISSNAPEQVRATKQVESTVGFTITN